MWRARTHTKPPFRWSGYEGAGQFVERALAVIKYLICRESE